MTTPTYCSDCGHELGIGRFCTNCGRPVPGRHPEAAPPVSAPPAPPPAPPTMPAVLPPPAPPPATAPRAVPPVVPPSAGHVPTSARFPLYADAPQTVVTPSAPAQPPVGAPPAHPPAGNDRSAPRWVPWVIAIVLLALAASLGAFLLLSGGDDDRADDDNSAEQGTTGSTLPTEATSRTPEQPDSTGSGEAVPEPDPADVMDLSSGVTAQVPAVAPPSRNRQNKPVKYDAKYMWDGKPRTTWRMPGDGTGTTLTFDLGSEVVLTKVGLINGYAKVDGPDNWYASNRRIRAVQWEFDDGTRVTQDFADKQNLQMAAVGPIRTRTIKIHLLKVTAPGKGTAGRDYTAISEIRFLGAPG